MHHTSNVTVALMEVLFTLPNGASVSDRDTFGIDLLSETRYNAVYRVSRV